MVRVLLAGHRGKVGTALVPALEAAGDIEYLGGIGREDDLEAALAARRPDALVDFTHPSSGLRNGLAAAARGAAPIIGTTGLAPADVDRLQAACEEAGVGGVVAPNFAVGAVLLLWLAERAAPFFDGVEIIEAHAATKADAPSGTAIATAARLGAARDFRPAVTERLLLEGARGAAAAGVAIHSVRLPGLVADQQVLFGLPGQTLTLEHRTTSREAFAPGVLLALRTAVPDRRFHRGMDTLLGLA